MTELLLGCGHRRVKSFSLNGQYDWQSLVTLDVNPDCKPDILHDLNVLPWPLESECFDEIHAYEVLEHLGRQGDFKSFFDHFAEIYRLLKPGGLLFATVPAPKSGWVWGDPSHTRVISMETLTFLSQQAYTDQVGKTSMTDFRSYWKGNLPVVWHQDTPEHLLFVLQAQK